MSATDRLTAALSFANYKTAMHNRKNQLRMQLEDELNYATSGGIFAIDMHLISFVDTLIRSEHTEAVLIDSRKNPVLVVDLPAFLDAIMSKYFEATNTYHSTIMRLNKARTVEQVAAV